MDAPNPFPQSKLGKVKTDGLPDNIYDISGQKVNNIIELNQKNKEKGDT